MSQQSYLPLVEARRAAWLLSAAAAIGGSVGPISIGTGGLVGAALLPPDQIGLATLPVTTFVIGSALAAIPAALWMRRVGRRLGFITGVACGAVGAGLAATAIIVTSFWFFAVAMMLVGAANAFSQQYRFAAADAAEPAFKPRAIAWVMAGGVVTGVVGPQVAIHARVLTPDAPFAGPFLVLVVLFALTALLLSRLVVPPPVRVSASSAPSRPLSAIVLKPQFLVALVSSIASYSLMSLVMTATPLAMVEHHHSPADAQLGIQWHVIAMFAPSFFTGSLIARFGKPMVIVAGFVLIGAAASVALTGTGLWQFWISLVLLGVGWNFGFLASTAMVAELYRPEEAARVQAFNEFTLFGIVALASFGSGALLSSYGWTALNLSVYPVVGLCVLLVVLQAVSARRPAISH